VTAADLREALAEHGIYSPHFTVEVRGDKLRLSGKGHGHGVGLCQWGARGQALAGRSCEQIISHYYRGATIVRDGTW
jgi:stage II sporulation protein D